MRKYEHSYEYALREWEQPSLWEALMLTGDGKEEAYCLYFAIEAKRHYQEFLELLEQGDLSSVEKECLSYWRSKFLERMARLRGFYLDHKYTLKVIEECRRYFLRERKDGTV